MRKNAGFTLLELMVALVLFSFIGMGSYKMLVTVLDAREATARHADSLRALQRMLFTIDEDFTEIIRRPLPQQGKQSAGQEIYFSGGESGTLMRFTRQGWRPAFAEKQADLAEVAYLVKDGALMRRITPVPVIAGKETPPQTLVEKVTNIRIRFLDKKQVWHDKWPVYGKKLPTIPGLKLPRMIEQPVPQAVELFFTVPGYGEIRRLLVLP